MPPLREGCDPRRTGSTMKLKLRDVAQLFNPLDPSPISEEDLDWNDARSILVSFRVRADVEHAGPFGVAMPLILRG